MDFCPYYPVHSVSYSSLPKALDELILFPIIFTKKTQQSSRIKPHLIESKSMTNAQCCHKTETQPPLYLCTESTCPSASSPKREIVACEQPHAHLHLNDAQVPTAQSWSSKCFFVALCHCCHKTNSFLRFWGTFFNKTSQELRMLSSVTINCQITKIVMNSGSQLSEL